jgi:membrane protein YqaA with SNARE-associated domain
MLMKPLRGLYDWTMEKALHPKAEWWLAFFAFVESSFFPIPPHPLLGLMCLAEPKKAIRFAAVTTGFSVLGGLFGYLIGWGLYDLVGQQLLALLGLTEEFPQAACYLNRYDWEAIVIAGATPIPFKLLTITAGFVSMHPVTFLLASIAGRGFIFMTVGILFRLFGAPIKKVIDEYLGTVTTVFVLLVVGGFIALAQFGGDEEQDTDPCARATMADLGVR